MAKVCCKGGQVQGWSSFPCAADTGSVPGAHQVSPHSPSKLDLFPSSSDIQRVERYLTTQQSLMSKQQGPLQRKTPSQKSPASKGEISSPLASFHWFWILWKLGQHPSLLIPFPQLQQHSNASASKLKRKALAYIILKKINLVFHRILSGLHPQPQTRKTLISMYLVLLFTPIIFSTSLTLIMIVSCYLVQSSTGSTDQATRTTVGSVSGHEEDQTSVALLLRRTMFNKASFTFLDDFMAGSPLNICVSL